MPIQKYFKEIPGAPAPLTYEIKRTVRFDELDPLAIVWHGNYASWFEEARVALGKHYGIGYLDFSDNGVVIPIKKLHADYSLPLQFDKQYTVRAILHWNLAARLDYEFEIYDENGNITTRGYTVHMMLDKDSNVLVVKPAFYEEFSAKWEKGLIK
ncbi:acyl-CoA thioester hydrolase [Elusimicrobium posterum]|uniref:acyl-CoA thioesterase n=1 Tax=Elusimicrobium posterum TaxID=3116653 RepID=UPI003C7193D1